MTKLTAVKIASMRNLASAGWTEDAIAREVGIARSRVAAWARRENRVLGAPAPVVKVVRPAGPVLAVEIPHWVPAALRDDYHRIAMASGEEDAARHARRRKVEMREEALA